VLEVQLFTIVDSIELLHLHPQKIMMMIKKNNNKKSKNNQKKQILNKKVQT
jgi:hypothetical protein